ncbi:MAG TPA: hypothetical protein VG274_01850, partial [Rhizomicrobium sp.]|nr:hypothetical protein [Rhizomicrobium sp.]
MGIPAKSVARPMRIGHLLAAGIACLLALGGPALARSSRTQSGEAGGTTYAIRFDHWSDQDERDFGEFIAGIGDSGCTTVDTCLRDPSNPFRASDIGGSFFQADCAKLMYILRAYFAWKRGLPFSYANGVAPVGGGADARYSPEGNRVTSRAEVLTGSASGYALLNNVLSSVSSANYRMHPDLDSPLRPDFYSVAINAKSVRPGTAMYDPNGHVGIVYKVESDGRIRLIGSHPDNTLTRDYYDLRFVRSRPGVGAGFKNWRPVRLVGYTRRSDGALVGGHMELASNSEIPDFSDEQYYGNGQRPTDEDWASGTFSLNGETVDYYDYVRAKIAGGRLEFDPVKEVADMVDSNCSDLHDRVQAVNIALQAGI